MNSVLYVGCPLSERAETEKVLATADLSVVWADSAAYAFNELQRREMPVLLDLCRGAAALQIARELRAQRAATLMFAVVDARRPDLTVEAVLAGMADVFARPLGGRRVANAIERELAYDAAQDAGANGPAPAGGADLYTHSASMRDVVRLIARAASMRAGVLVRGEDGTGRQVVARAIHAQQDGTGAQFVAVDCAVYDGEDLERVLFGEAGSAAERALGEAAAGLERIGSVSRLYDARGGTLYLQNITDASTRVQARLARVLRDREALLTDTGETLSCDVRPMASVDAGIDSAVEEGRVRDDLFRRLSVIRIDMPPLRSRREDIPALANYFVREVCAVRRVPPKVLSRSALSLIAALPWRRNAVELRTLLETVIAGLEPGRGIGLDDVLRHVRLDGGAAVFAHGGTLRQARSRFERDYIAAVLEQHHGRISEAAKALGIQRTNLYRKMRALKVTRGVRRGS